MAFLQVGDSCGHLRIIAFSTGFDQTALDHLKELLVGVDHLARGGALLIPWDPVGDRPQGHEVLASVRHPMPRVETGLLCQLSADKA